MWDWLAGKLARVLGWAFTVSLIVSGMVYLFDHPLGLALLVSVGTACFVVGILIIVGFVVWFLCGCVVAIIRAR